LKTAFQKRQCIPLFATSVVALLFSFSSFAQNSTSTETKSLSSESNFVPPQSETGSVSFSQPQKSFRSFFGELRYESLQYVTTLPESPNLTSSQFLSARLAGLYQPRFSSRLNFGGDISAGTFFIRSQSNYLVKELYASYRISDQTKATVGRKKYQWSALDSYWLMSVWQPNFAIDLLRPEEQGLFGAFLDHQEDDFQIMGFATPIFIPSIGPDIREEGGSLVSDSRWYRRPSDKYNFNDRINSITYRLDIPEIQDLIGKPGMGFAGRWGKINSGAWLASSYGYKPMNDLLLRRQNFKIIDEDKVDVKVRPDATYHSVFSADVGYAFPQFSTTLSYLEDNPVEKKPDADWVIQRPNSLRAYSLLMDFQLPNFFDRTLQMQLAYLRVSGADIIDITSDGEVDSMTLFDDRLRFKDAVSVRVQGPLAQIFRRSLVTKFSYLYDYAQKGSLVSTEFHYFPATQWSVLLGADVLGVEDLDSSSSGFLNQYRANDRFYGGISYVF